MSKPVFPRMYLVEQEFACPQISNPSAEVTQELLRHDFAARVTEGQSVAITAGSRGIAGIAEILRSVVEYFRQAGAKPFLVPAMGSHGGATAKGQLQTLHDLGITTESTGAEIRASMETIVVTHLDNGLPVHFDRIAFEADHVFVVNRVKPHTRFTGPVESGLLKMLLIGLGKHAGATLYHQAINDLTFTEILNSVTAEVIQRCDVLGGLAIVENAFDQTACIEAIMPREFLNSEPRLLEQAKRWLPTLPFPDVDLLIVDRIGKNISGTGMDANVVGRKYNDHAATEDDIARCKRILVRSLTPETQGNACGLGMAEFTTTDCVRQVDFEKTSTNVITASHPEAGMIPLAFATDALAVQQALKTIGTVAPAEARIIQVADTLHLKQVRLSEAYLSDMESHDRVQILEGPFDFPVSADGRLQDV